MFEFWRQKLVDLANDFGANFQTYALEKNENYEAKKIGNKPIVQCILNVFFSYLDTAMNVVR